jgi:hypothetical protein
MSDQGGKMILPDVGYLQQRQTMLLHYIFLFYAFLKGMHHYSDYF